MSSWSNFEPPIVLGTKQNKQHWEKAKILKIGQPNEPAVLENNLLNMSIELAPSSLSKPKILYSQL